MSPPKGETFCPDDRPTVTQTFTPIGGTVAEIAVTEQIQMKIQSITADLISDNMHTSVAFVNNNSRHSMVISLFAVLNAVSLKSHDHKIE